jgi:hypothetical protein
MGFVASVCQPSTLRMLICPEASSAQNNIAAVSADGRTVCVLIRRLNSSCLATDLYLLGCRRVDRTIRGTGALSIFIIMCRLA